jgi:hypothetical protein
MLLVIFLSVGFFLVERFARAAIWLSRRSTGESRLMEWLDGLVQ